MARSHCTPIKIFGCRHRLSLTAAVWEGFSLRGAHRHVVSVCGKISCESYLHRPCLQGLPAPGLRHGKYSVMNQLHKQDSSMQHCKYASCTSGQVTLSTVYGG